MTGSPTTPNLRSMLNVAIPMIVSQSTESIMLFFDRVFLSRLSPIHLAASMSGGLTSFMIAAFMLGMLGFITPLTAQYYGAKQYNQCSKIPIQGISLAGIYYIFMLSMIPFAPYVFSIAGHSAEQLEIESLYLSILLAGSFFLLASSAIASFFVGIGQTKIIMIANLIGTVLNIFANYVLIFGHFGFPALGIVGAATATIISRFVIFLILFFSFINHDIYRNNPYKVWKVDKNILKKLFKFGIPTGTEFFLSIASFNAFILVTHSYGESISAAVTVAFSFDMISFIPLIGVSYAVSSFAGKSIGTGDPDGVKGTALLGFKITLVYTTFTCLLFLFGTNYIVTIFTQEGSSYYDLSIILVKMVALYTIFDGLSLVYSGALKGVGDTRWLMFTSIIYHWVFTIIAIILAKFFYIGIIPIFSLFILMILSLAITYLIRFSKGKWRSIKVIEPVSPTAALDDFHV